MQSNDVIERRMMARLRAIDQSLYEELLRAEERAIRAEECRIVAIPPTRRMRIRWYQGYLIHIYLATEPIALGWRCSICRRPTYVAHECIVGAEVTLASHLTPTERVRRAERTLERLVPLEERLNKALSFVQRNPPKTLLPKVSRDRALTNARVLAQGLTANPKQPTRCQTGCWNCGMPHNMTLCPHPRGTFCLRCGEIGVYFEECRRCQPGCSIDGHRRR